MFDLHTHILPGVDDGPQNIEDTLKLAEEFAASGVKTAVATPHFIRGSSEVDKKRILALVLEVNDILKERKINLTLLPGMEIEICHEILDLWKEGRLLTLNDNGRYLLVELPFNTVPPFTEQLFYELQLAGIIPVLAHPERNAVLGENIKMVYDLASRGTLIQINSGSILGYFGNRVKNTAVALLKNNLVHVVASDAHGAHGERGPGMHLARPVLEKIIGPKWTQVLLQEHSRAIIEGKDLIRREPIMPVKSGFWSKLFSR